METQQMAMPAEMAAQGPNPEEMAIYDQMRQQISPQEFSNEMLASASQVDPQAVAEFTQELQSLDVSPEELDALNDLVDQILASPEQYDQLRQQYLAQGMPDDILPEQFDPYFFAALNMAVDQMIAAPTGVQAFAQGGIAELKPIAKAIASYGRNGDTMLAHITPAEARMLRRRGGSGTINPATGLPEFFLKKAFKSIGKAVKKFAQSSIGRIVLPIALGFFLGPAAASVMGVGAGTAAGLAVSGFVGGAGSTLLAGGNLKDALKAGAIGGVLAGAGGVLSGAELTGAATMTPGQALQSRVDQFTGMFKPGTSLQASVPQAGGTAEGLGPNQMAMPDSGQGLDISAKKVGVNLDGTRVNPLGSPNGALPPADAAYDLNMQAQQAARTGSTFDPKNALTDNVTTSAQRDAYMASQGLNKPPSLIDQAKDFYTRNTPSAIQQTGAENAIKAVQQRFPGVTAAQIAAAPANSPMALAYKAALPGVLQTYGPTMAAGLGIMGLAGGFESKPTQGGDITQSLMKPVTQRIREAGTQSQMYMQGLPGVVYDEFGAPVFGQSTRLPTYDVPDYGAGGFRSFSNLTQPYNNSSMYTNIMPPQRYADGGQVQYFDVGGDVAPVAPLAGKAAPPAKTPEQLAAERKAALEATIAQQKAGRDIANQRRAERRAQGSGNMYANINAGLAALAPENFPGAPVQLDPAREAAMRSAFSQAKPVSDIDYARVMQQQGYRPEEVAALTGSTFGDINRRFRTAVRQDAAAPMLQGQRDAMAAQRRTLENARGIEFPGAQSPVAPPITTMPVTPPVTQLPVTPPVTQLPVTPPGDELPITTMPVTPPVTQPAVTNTQITDFLAANPGMTDAQTRAAMDQFGVGTAQMAAATGLPVDQIQQRYDTASKFNNQDIVNFLNANQGMTDAQIRAAMDQFGVGTAQMASATGLPFEQIQQRYNAAAAPRLLNMGGIAGLAQGGYPRRTGQISGPGTEKSDSIPAMLSDGEFVMTAKAVRGAGKGNRRAGAKQMYKLMHQLEKNSERG